MKKITETRNGTARLLVETSAEIIQALAALHVIKDFSLREKVIVEWYSAAIS